MRGPLRVPLNRNNTSEEKTEYANFSQTRIITLFQIPQYEHLQILICNGNSLTTLAGVEHIKHLWKLDVGNNQIRSLQHLSRFIALGSLILSNNRLPWVELQHIRHMSVLDLRLDGNPILDSDPNYRQHVLDCLTRVWMCDGVFVSTTERNQIDEFFTQSSLSQKPVRRKLARDIFMPTNLKDRTVNGLFGSKATELFAKFPINCFINSELDKKRIKHLASTIQELLLTEMKCDERKEQDPFLTENRHIFYHMIDLRQVHIEEFNMFLILLLTDMLFEIPVELLDNVLDVTHIKTIGNLNISHVFSSSEQLKCMVASLILAGARVDRDENHPSAFYEKLFNSISTVLTYQIRQLSTFNANQTHSNNGLMTEAKAMVCLEVMQVFILCPLFYLFIDNPSVNSIFKQALDRSPAYGSIQDVLQGFNADQKTPQEQKDLLSPILGNILKMTIRTLSTKRVKKIVEPSPVVYETAPSEIDDSSKQTIASPRPSSRANRHPMIGDRILIAPQNSGRIVTLPDAEIAMIQLDHVLGVNGAMISNGTLSDHTNYVNMSHFEWDVQHEYWKPKFTSGDKITLQMTTVRSETPRSISLPPPQRTASPKSHGSVQRVCTTPKLFDMNLNRPIEVFIEPRRELTHAPSPRPPPPPPPPPPPVLNFQHDSSQNSQIMFQSPPPSSPGTERRPSSPDNLTIERPMSVRITRQRHGQQMKGSSNGETVSQPPILIESVLLLMPDQPQTPTVSFQHSQQPTSSSITMNDTAPSVVLSGLEHSSISNAGRRSATQRVHVPIHNASHWFNGPDMQNERTSRMEKVVASLGRRTYRPLSTYAMPRVPTLTSPSSRNHAHYKGARPESFQDFCIESHRMTPTPIRVTRQSLSGKGRYTPTTRSYDFHRTNTSVQNIPRIKSLLNPPCPTPTWT